MRSHIREKEALREALRKAYFAQEREVSRDQWRHQIMKCLRNIGPLRPFPNFLSAFEHMVWRLAPANALLILCAIVLLFNMDFDLDYDYLGTWTADLDKPVLTEFLDLEG